MKKYRLILTALFLFQGCFLFNTLSAADLSFSRKTIEKHILRFEFDVATHLLTDCPDPYAKAYYINHIYFLKVFASDDPGYKTRFYQSCEQSLQVFEKMPKTNPYKKYYQAEVYFLRGIIHFLSKKYLPAGLDLRSSYSRVKSNAQEFPALMANHKLLGLYEAGLSIVPEKYQYITNLLGYHGDLLNGIEKMRIASKTSEIFPEESHLLLCYAQRKLLDDTDLSLRSVKTIHATDPGNILYTFVLANIAVNNRRSGEALKYLNNLDVWKQNKNIFYIQFLDYLRGKALFHNLEYAGALRDLSNFIHQYKGSNFVVDAMFKRALIYELQGDHATARPLFLEITKLSKNDFDMDNYAIRYAPIFAQRPFTEEELILQKARNLFDGGFFAESAQELSPMMKNVSDLPEEVILEINYRMGRISQEQKNGVKAKTYYLVAMGNKTSASHPAYWMKVYSTYYVGGMYEDEGKYADAVRFYKQALAHKDYQYQNDLEQMAKSGIDRLKKKI